MVVDELVKNPGAWLSMSRGTGIIISSRVRLARNVRGVAFPGWASEDECVALRDRLHDALAHVPELADPIYLDMAELDSVDKDVLKERRLISAELAESGRGSALVLSGDERLAVMINEEDHLRLQGISPGMGLISLWHRINALDSRLESAVEYAYAPGLGYLTACPSNVGTGLRASVMMHLSGLKLMNEIDPVINALDKLGLAVRGQLGEGTEASGNLYQISNQVTLGESEDAIIGRLVKVVRDVKRHEQNARARLLESKPTFVLDQVGRAVGVLGNARILSSREAIELLSMLRLGVEFGLLKDLTVARLNEIMLLIQPGHLQRTAGRTLDADERDELRARIVKTKLGSISVSG